VEPALLARIEIERFEPAPQQVRADGEALLFAFATVPGKPARVRMFFRPKRFGPLVASVAVGPQRLDFRQFVYP